MTGPGSMSRFVAKARKATHDALRCELKDADGSPIDLRQVQVDRLDVDFDNAAIDYERHFGRDEAIRKVRSLLRILEATR